MNIARSKKTHGRSNSFRPTVDYVMHDKNAQTQHRVGAVLLLNFATMDPCKAWREMQTTVEAAAAIKVRTGIKASGRKSEKPVYHYAVSWHPNDRPTPAHMLDMARDTIRLLGLSEHQALIVQHTDVDHAHVHVVLNLVHPETGRTAPLSYDWLRMNSWAHAYEVQHTIRSFNRALKLERTMPERTDDERKKERVRDAIKLKERIERKRDALEIKHRTAGEIRLREEMSSFREYKRETAKIERRYSIGNGRAPTLEIKPPSLLKQRREWMELARAMRQAGMFDPLRREFGRALKAISPLERRSLGREFHHAGRTITPLRGARNFPQINARTMTAACNMALTQARAEYDNRKFDLGRKHQKQIERETQEHATFKREVQQAWREFREQHLKSPTIGERGIHREAFNRAAPAPAQVRTELTKNQWQRGTIGEYTFHAKLEPASDGNRYVAAIELRDQPGRTMVEYRDGRDHPYVDGWNRQPELPEREAIEAIVDFYARTQEMPTVERKEAEREEPEMGEYEIDEPEMEIGQ